VFAGDQFQTLNPTGFRWEAIKAFFVEKFIFALATHRPKTLDLNYRELTYNYRSSRSIVRFSNYVQALRARLFDLTTLQPQQPWEHELNPPPVTHFLRDNDDLWARLKIETDVVIIIPCGEGEEARFVQEDPVLKTKVGFNEDGSLGMTVISAVGAKGLEFPRVVVYGFGEAADAMLLAPLRDESKVFADDPDRSLPMQYFINRLYVAVSRAKRRMFIVDSKEGFKKLWDFAQNDDLEQAILNGFKKDRTIWEMAIERLQPGRTDDLSSDRADDPLEIAVSLASDGRARSYHAGELKQAVELWDSASERGSHEYRIAKAFSAPYPEKLAALNEFGKFKEIILEYEAHRDVQLSRDQSRFVGRAYLNQKNYDSALLPLIEGRDTVGIGDLVLNIHLQQPSLALKGAVALFAVAAIVGDWAAILPYIQGKSLPGIAKPEKTLIPWIVDNKRTLDLAFLRSASRSESLSNLTWDGKREQVTQRPFADYIQKTFFQSGKLLVQPEYVDELGAAIERSGRRLDALRFYEIIRTKTELDESLRERAQERWVACKEQHVWFLQQEGNKNIAEVAANELKKERDALGMMPDDKLDEFPKLNSLEKYLGSIVRGSATAHASSILKAEPANSASVAPEASGPRTDKSDPKQTEGSQSETEKDGLSNPQNASRIAAKSQNWSFGDLQLDFFRDSGRLNITDQTGSTASVRMATFSCTSGDVTIKPTENESHKFNIIEWNLVVDMSQPKLLVLRQTAEQTEFRINV
jgi:hypothetical protein